MTKDLESKIIKNAKLSKEMSVEFAERTLERHIASRLEQANAIEKGEVPKFIPYDIENYIRPNDISYKEHKFTKTFTDLLLWYQWHGYIRTEKFSTESARLEVVKIYKKVYDRALEALIELGEIKKEYVKR